MTVAKMGLKPAALSVLAAAAHIMAQTPPGTTPATNSALSVAYGSTRVSPGLALSIKDTANVPTVSFKATSSSQYYSLLLVDLSIKKAQVNTSELVPGVQVPLVQGIASDRTTRLHFWQPNVTFSSDGTLKNNSAPIAYYNGPAPPAGDIAHTYAFYLFEQAASWVPPPPGNPFNQAEVNKKPTNRYSFNVSRLAGEQGIGALAAANFITVQNNSTSSSSSSSSSPTTGTSASASASASSTASSTKASVAPFTSSNAASEPSGPVGSNQRVLPTVVFALAATVAIFWCL